MNLYCTWRSTYDISLPTEFVWTQSNHFWEETSGFNLWVRLKIDQQLIPGLPVGNCDEATRLTDTSSTREVEDLTSWTTLDTWTGLVLDGPDEIRIDSRRGHQCKGDTQEWLLAEWTDSRKVKEQSPGQARHQLPGQIRTWTVPSTSSMRSPDIFKSMHYQSVSWMKQFSL